MCRWAAWVGKPIYLEDVISKPGHSLIEQSRAAEECKTAINADGFGVAWYGDRETPGLFRDVFPAWSDPNLRSLTAQVKSGLFLAHVRASTGTATSRNNCHPFAVGRWSFMHNGQIGGFEDFRRDADMAIPKHLYSHRKGATDSEALFLLALSEGLDQDPIAAMERAVFRLETMSRELGKAPHARIAAAFSDGERLYAVRYASDDHAPSLYHCYDMVSAGRLVVSEPLNAAQDWQEISPNSVCVFEADQMQEILFLTSTARQVA